MVKLLALLVSCVTLNAAVSDDIRRLPPVPPMPVKVSLTNVQQAIRTLVALDVATTIQTHTNYAEDIAYHFGTIADVFKRMSEDGAFTVEHLNAELAQHKAVPEWGATVENVRTALVVLYSRCYEHRGRAEMPPLDFLAAIANTFHEAIREGVTKAGKAHVLKH